jgi:parallel beta-helix repeat protein
MTALLALLMLWSQSSAHHTIVVHPGQSIQAAIDSAHPGYVIEIQSGTYHEAGRPCPYEPNVTCALVVTKDDITLMAAPSNTKPVVINNPKGFDTGINVGKANATQYHCERNARYRINTSRIVGLTVNGFGGSGIVLQCVDNWELAYNDVNDNKEYGLYPTMVGSGRAHHNVATGSHDTGIYVGQSHSVRVDHNIAYHNVSGYELENSYDSQIDHNTSFHNTAGILEFTLPNLTVMENHSNTIDDNFIHDNNAPNTCIPGDEVCGVPPGTGLLMIAGDRNVTLNNTVVGNKTYGVALADFCTAFMLPPSQCNPSILGFDPNPNKTEIRKNTASANGVDLIWTGLGSGDCWADNRAGTRVPKRLPQCKGA